MRTTDIFKVFETFHPELASKAASYGTLKGSKDAIKIRDKKGHLYIFEYKDEKRWSLYYGAAAVEYERRNKK